MDNLIYRHMSLILYGAPPADEVEPTDTWDYLTAIDPTVNGPRHFRKGEGVRVHKNHVTIRHDSYEWIPDERAIGELKALMAAWRQAGMGDFANAVETREESDGEEFSEVSIYESLGTSKTNTTYIRVPIKDVKFYREKPYDPTRGLADVIREPRSFARITGIDSSPL